MFVFNYEEFDENHCSLISNIMCISIFSRALVSGSAGSFGFNYKGLKTVI